MIRLTIELLIKLQKTQKQSNLGIVTNKAQNVGVYREILH